MYLSGIEILRQERERELGYHSKLYLSGIEMGIVGVKLDTGYAPNCTLVELKFDVEIATLELNTSKLYLSGIEIPLPTRRVNTMKVSKLYLSGIEIL